MEMTTGGEKKAMVLEQRAAQRFGVAVRLTIDGDGFNIAVRLLTPLFRDPA